MGRADNVRCSEPTQGMLLRSKSKVAQHVLEARPLAEAQRALLLHLYVLRPQPDARRGSSRPWPLRWNKARRHARLHGVPHHLVARSQHLLPLRARPAQLRNSAIHSFRHAAHGVGVLLALLLQPSIGEPLVEGLKKRTGSIKANGALEIGRVFTVETPRINMQVSCVCFPTNIFSHNMLGIKH